MNFKKLVWDFREVGYAVAYAPVTEERYSIALEEGLWFPLWDSTLPGFKSLEDVQAAAQKDFEETIMEAFEQ